MNKLIVILGPTASGKSALAIELAREFNGEIVSADSRQVYRGLDIGAGKVTKDEQAQVPHHLLDIVDPMDDFSLAHYQRAAFIVIDDIIGRGKLPFLVGGAALYIYSVIDNYELTGIEPNTKRRQELERLSIDELQTIFSRHSYPRILTASDQQNPRRLIRAIEKLEAGAALAGNKKPARYDALILGIDVPRAELYKKIDRRVDDRMQPASSAGMGMIEEVMKLRQSVPDEKLIGFGLEYRFITEYLLGRWPSREAMAARLKTATHAFARRQMTWWKRDKRIAWVRNTEDAQNALSAFLKKKAAG